MGFGGVEESERKPKKDDEEKKPSSSLKNEEIVTEKVESVIMSEFMKMVRGNTRRRYNHRFERVILEMDFAD